MKPADLAQVIRGPFGPGRLDVALDDELFSQLLSDLASNADALPLLEFVLAELWGGMEIDRRGRSLSRSSTIGSVACPAPSPDTPMRRSRIWNRTRASRSGCSSNSCASAPPSTTIPVARGQAELDVIDARLWPIAEVLANRRLLVTGDGPGVDIVHEALFRQWRRLADWIEGERDFLRWRQRLEERRREWDEAGREHGGSPFRQRVDEATVGSPARGARRTSDSWSTSAAASPPRRPTSHCLQSPTPCGTGRAELGRRVPRDMSWKPCSNWEVRRPRSELQFLRGAIVSVPGHAGSPGGPNIVSRAALGLDRALAAHVFRHVGGLGASRARSTAGTDLGADCDRLVRGAHGRADIWRTSSSSARPRASRSTISSYQLRAYGEIFRAFAERSTPNVDTVARALV